MQQEIKALIEDMRQKGADDATEVRTLNGEIATGFQEE